MATPPRVQTGQVPHPAARVVQGDSCLGVFTTSEDHLVTQGNTAGIPVMKIGCRPILCYGIKPLFSFDENVFAH